MHPCNNCVNNCVINLIKLYKNAGVFRGFNPWSQKATLTAILTVTAQADQPLLLGAVVD